MKVLTVEGVDPSGDPLQDGVLHFSPPHTLDAQILEAADDNKQQTRVGDAQLTERQGCQEASTHTDKSHTCARKH